MAYKTIAVWAILAIALAPPVAAQQPAAPTSPSKSFLQRGEISESYKFAPGDVVSVQVMNFPELSSKPPVQPDGEITLPLVGSVKVAGKTSVEVQETLTTKLSEYLKSPVVIVTIEEFHTPTVWVLGQVKSPQPVRYQPGFAVSDYLSAAGGSTDTADLSRISLNRADKTSTTVDLSSRADPSAKLPEIAENDLIVVPEVKGNVSVLGKVAKPGAFPYQKGMRLSDAISLAGGPLDDGDPAQTKIVGASKTLVADYQAFIENAKSDQNVEIQPGDVVFVPESTEKVHLFGAVTKPGVYRLRPGETIMALILRAGGLAADSSPSSAALVRPGTETPETTRIDLTKYMRQGDLASNPQLRSADIVYVPEKGREKQFWNQITQGSVAIVALFQLFGLR